MTSTEIISNLERLEADFETAIRPLGDEQSIRAAQAQFLGKSGRVSELMKELRTLPAAEKPAVGAAANKVKQTIEQLTAERLDALAGAAAKADLDRRVDVTLPATPDRRRVICTCSRRSRREVDAIFAQLGFVVADGPQIETDLHNFEALAMPKDHPARDMQDTFYIEGATRRRCCARTPARCRSARC